MVKEAIEVKIKKAYQMAVDEGSFQADRDCPEVIFIEKPKTESHGDFACGVSLKLARHLKLAPMKIAETLKNYIEKVGTNGSGAMTVEAAQPGFLNFQLDKSFLSNIIFQIASAGESFGKGKSNGKKILIEYVSANPTGGLHIGHGRNAILGSSLANLLSFAGWHVVQEFYINDCGEQINKLTKSGILALIRFAINKEMPYVEGGYPEDSLLDYMLDSEENRSVKEVFSPIVLKINTTVTENLQQIVQDIKIDKIPHGMRPVRLQARLDLHQLRLDKAVSERFSVPDLKMSLMKHLNIVPFKTNEREMFEKDLEDVLNTDEDRTSLLESLLLKVLDEISKTELEQFSKNLVEIIKEEQKILLGRVQVTFDNWFSEESLHQENKVEQALEAMSKYTYESEGALWLKAKELGDERDRVLKKSTGATTYLANDAAYHLNKYKRGFDLMVNIWGADHHGQVPGLKAVVKALGEDPDKLDLLLTQIVNLNRDGKPVKMSKRMGTVVMLDEVLEEVGADAVRYYLAESNPNNPINFDLELAKKTSKDNPAFYIQYAHARCCSILRRAGEEYLDSETGKMNPPRVTPEQMREIEQAYGKDEHMFDSTFDNESDNPEAYAAQKKLVLCLSSLPDEVEEAARVMQPGRIARYSYEIACDLQRFYEVSRVLSEDLSVTRSRLGLIMATRQVLKNTLKIIGVSAPERM